MRHGAWRAFKRDWTFSRSTADSGDPHYTGQCRKMIRYGILAVLVTASIPIAVSQEAPPAQPFTELKGCTLLTNPFNDGDSFHVRTPDGKEQIFRLYFVDTPESENSFPERVAEQATYFGIDSSRTIQVGIDAARFTSKRLAGTFTVYTRWKDALGRSQLQRFYAFVKVGPDYLQDLLVQNGLARVYGVRTPLPDGRDSREYLAKLTELEKQAQAARLGGWGGGTAASSPTGTLNWPFSKALPAAPLVPAPALSERKSAETGFARPDRTPRTDGQCAAITKAGTKCTRKAKPGSPYCWQHQL